MSDAHAFASSLTTAPARFLSEALEHGLRKGRRTSQDFIRHFPPRAIMAALDGQPKLRAELLAQLIGLREKTALRTPTEDAGRLLQVALEEKDTTPDAIVAALDPDAKVRHLEATKIWAFIVEGELWKVSRSKDQSAHKLAQADVALLCDRAMVHGLVGPTELLDGIGIDVLAEKLPRAELAKIMRRALGAGREGAPFRDQELLEVVPPSVLVDHVALSQIMDGVIAPMARTAGFGETPTATTDALRLAIPETFSRTSTN